MLNMGKVFSFKTLSEIDLKLRKAFNKIKQELSEHLEAINNNTNEIQNNYEAILELQAKIDKLTERLDNLTLALNPHFSRVSKSLNHVEREIFLILYKSKRELTPIEISHQTGLPVSTVENVLQSLINAGIPIIVVTNYENSHKTYLLDPVFRDLQANMHLVDLELQN